MKRKDKNSFFYAILKTLNKKVPGLIHQCPYQVSLKFYVKCSLNNYLTKCFQGSDLQIRNLALGASDLALWITGEYKVVYTFSDDQDNKIFRVSGLGEIKRN